MSEITTQGAGRALFVVGVGASAGGVAALERLFKSTPADIGAAFVVVTHIGAHRETLLAQILARHTTLTVANAQDGVQLAANHIYVLSSDAVITMSNGRLSVQAAEAERHERNPIDVFFTSLANDAADNAVGIVLSGAGSDGSFGMTALKEEGGLTIAQGHDPSGPSHEGMPSSAIATGLVDMVLPVDEIGVKLQEYFASFRSLSAAGAETAPGRRPEDLGGALKDIHETLQKRVGHDFSRYKEKTLLRRIHRRMQVLQVDSLDEYAERLHREGDEARLLFRDLLIGVTRFFRDETAFDALSEKALPNLFDGLGPGDTVRVWVPGCATGEEAYSLAILLRERMLAMTAPPKVQVFATDIDEAALAIARTGRYPRALLEHASEARLKRFFRAEPASYVLTKEVRDLCIFSAHSIIRDPPFSRMDMVSCRNLLIYFNNELQDNVLPVLHYALKSGGYLFLGPAESVSRHTDLFGVVDKKHGIYQRRSIINASARIPSWMPSEGVRGGANVDRVVRQDRQLWKQIESQVMEHFAPAHIVVEAEGDVVYYSARTGKYLEPQAGSPSRQLLSMVRRGLRLELRTMLREAAEHQRIVTRESIEVELEDRVQLIRLTVQPLLEPNQELLYLVVFADLGRPLSHEEVAGFRIAGSPADIGTLEQELKETRERLQSTIEEYETALEELKSGNEELVSVNEELQSTNEELETSKEELQSVNEELNTVNLELAAKVDELHQSNMDLRNLFESTQIATVFLDRFYIIRSFTPAITTIFNLISTDRGRPITDISHRLEGVDLRADVQKVLDERKPLERPVRLTGGNVYHLMRILPYRTTDDLIEGTLITFVNVTEVVVAEEKQRLLVAELNHRVRNMLQVVIGLCNQSLRRAADVAEFETTFMGRIQALARAYELLSRDNWRRVPLDELVRTQLSPFASGAGRYTTQGERIDLTSKAALALGMVLYELATNATKYGALSTPEGRVALSWNLQRKDHGVHELVLRWSESGGPPVKKPTRSGFGSELVQRQLKYELSGEAELDFDEAGLRVTLVVPAADLILTGDRDAIDQ